jgi:hypothetical protein
MRIFLRIPLVVLFCFYAISCSDAGDNTPIQAVKDGVEDLDNSLENIELVREGTFIGDSGYETSGTARLFLNSGTETYSLVLDNFRSDPGPNLDVYLAENDRASGFENLGDLKSTNGTLRYDFPASLFDPANDHVLIWCANASINFGTAVLR